MQLILEESSAAPEPLHSENTVRCENHQTKKYRSGNTHETVPVAFGAFGVVNQRRVPKEGELTRVDNSRLSRQNLERLSYKRYEVWRVVTFAGGYGYYDGLYV